MSDRAGGHLLGAAPRPRDLAPRVDVQLWYARTGGGHRRVAEAVRSALLDVAGPGLRVAIDDPLDSGALPQARLLLSGYGPVVRLSPELWGVLFHSFSRPAARRLLELFLLTGVRHPMVRSARRRRPRVVVNCHPLLGPGAAVAAAEVGARVTTLITDLTLVHPGWLSPPGVPLLSPSAVATASCLDQGVAPELIRTTGLPVDPALEAGVGADRAALRETLGLDPKLPCVLISGGAEGAGDVLRILGEADRLPAHFQAVLLCGRNSRLLHATGSRDWAHPLVALPHLDDPSPWLLASDAYLGKAGPSAIAEGAAAGLALLLTGALPGQEQANLEWAVAEGAAVDASGAGGVSAALGTLLSSTRQLRRLQRSSSCWRERGSARRTAAAVLSLL